MSSQPPQKWVVSWAASVQGPYPVGNASAQPDLRFAFPAAARDQSFRRRVRQATLDTRRVYFPWISLSHEAAKARATSTAGFPAR